MIIFAKICKSKHYKDFILLFVHPTSTDKQGGSSHDEPPCLFPDKTNIAELQLGYIYVVAWQLLLLSVVFVRNCQLCATLCATCCQYATAVLCGHSLTETVLVLSLSVRGLECSFHRLIFLYVFSPKKYFTLFSLQNYSFFLEWQRFWQVILLLFAFKRCFRSLIIVCR